MTESHHLLVVEDDTEIVEVLRRYFRSQGFEVSVANGGEQMRAVLAHTTVSLVLLDLGLPGEDGFELTRRLRAEWGGPVIIVTGRGDAIDRVVGLELGADDYVTKPFELRELLARVRSVLRRSTELKSLRAPESAGDNYQFAGYRLLTDSRSLKAEDGSDVPLTSGEFDLLLALVAQPNRVLSRDQLMNTLHKRDAGPFDRAIDVQIGRLRRKIETDPTQPAMIKSVRGAGYLFATRVHRG